MSIDVGTHLKAVRQMYGLSQRELAKRAGVTNGLISLIEQNRVSPSVSSLKKVLDGVLAATFYYPLAVDKAMEIGDRILRDPTFKPEKKYMLATEIITPENAKQMYDKLTF